VHGFWSVEELAELADGPTGCGEMARGGRSFAWKGHLYLRWRREGLDQTWSWISDSLLAYLWKIPPAKNHALHYGQLRSVLLWLLSHSDHYAQRTAFTAQSLKKLQRTCEPHTSKGGRRRRRDKTYERRWLL